MPPMFRRLASVCVVALAACGGASDFEHPADEPHQPNVGLDWRDQVIYQIMIDRFSNGDPNNDINIAPSIPGRYHGGDWQGVIDHLDYLQQLGVTALWISPVVKNV
ncbi:MAG TPA: alpha-amylase family glycosyl hydrolase, partial [Kofleriaceae bacterium]|nr:alpha-amylase family glycosyl hydrolase [Kofleriaceae bacterium]